MVELAKEQAELSLSDFKDLPHKESFFDVIFSRYGLDYSDDLTTTMREWNRVLKTEGAIILTINNPKIYDEKPHFATLNGIDYHTVNLFEGNTRVIKPKYTINDFSDALKTSQLRCTFLHQGREHPKKYMSRNPNYLFMVLRKKDAKSRVLIPQEVYREIQRKEQWK